MLVLTRTAGETIILNGEIVVKILQVRGRSVSVGIEAPSHVSIFRGELKKEPLAATASSPSIGQRLAAKLSDHLNAQDYYPNKTDPLHSSVEEERLE